MTYIDVLKQVGYPEQVLVIDFETYFDQEYSPGKMSTIEYICDDQFDFTGMGYGFGDQIYFIPKPELNVCMKGLQQYYGQQFEEVTIVAKNCKFDMTVLAVKFGIIPSYIIDIDDLLRHYDARMSHKMKDVTSMFGLQPKGDTLQFKGLHYEDMDQIQKKALRSYSINDIEIEVGLFKILLPLLTNPTVEIPIARHTLDLYLRPSFKFDFKKARYLTASMHLALLEMADVTGYTKKELSGNISFVKILGEALPENETVPMKQGTKKMIPAFAKDDVAFQDLLAHPIVNVRNLCKARQAVKSWPLHIKRIYNMANQANASDGLLRVPLHYYGGHTGRWSGGEGINLQNLGGRGRTGSGTHPLIAAMRSLLIAPHGSTLGITDSSQIEARTLAWFASQDDLINDFATGKSPYCSLATKLFGTEVHKPSDEEKETPEGRAMAIKYGFGKDGILGCGYGMGTNKFYQRCIANEDLRPLFESGEYDWDFIDRLIKTYRSTYSKIPDFWRSVEKAFKWVIKYPHEQAQVSRKHDNSGTADGFRLTFFNKKGTVHIVLPSGRELTYRHSAIKKTTKGSEIRWHWGHLWGGSITENIVQAVARDLLAWWILEMEKAGLNVIFTNHDEIICMLSKNVGVYVNQYNPEVQLEKMLNIMCTGPDWAAGLPLDAEGKLSDVYTK